MNNEQIEQVEKQQKCYLFECNASCKVYVKVYADDLDSAWKYCNLSDCDEFEIVETKIEEITKYEIMEE